MRTRTMAAVVTVAALVAAGCGGSSSGGKNQGGKASNLPGSVTMMSAGESNGTAAYQQIFNELINSKVKYKATVESVSDFEQQFQIRAKSGTLKVAAAPQPGALLQWPDAGETRSLEDPALNI